MHHLHTVLLVDDETTIRDGLKHMIRWEQEGFRLLGDAANGQEALTLIDHYSNLEYLSLIGIF